MLYQVLLFTSISKALSGYIQVLNDNFSNMNNWVADTMPGANSGNGEWEYYTPRSVNVAIVNTPYGNALQLHAQQEYYQGYNYTSGKVHSAQQWGPYGFFNIRATVPKGQGLWPAIWMLPNGGVNQYGTWAACGEIDIMETVCNMNPGYSTLHFGGPWPQNVQYPNGGSNAYPFGVDWSQPHYFGVEWQPSFMTFWFDASVVNGVVQGTRIFTVPSSVWYSQQADGTRWPGNAPFNVPTNIILNVAIGGAWPCGVGCCDYIAVPANMYIYNVQIWEQAQVEETKVD
jgi:beta-glucanase (GH16 family)